MIHTRSAEHKWEPCYAMQPFVPNPSVPIIASRHSWHSSILTELADVCLPAAVEPQRQSPLDSMLVACDSSCA